VFTHLDLLLEAVRASGVPYVESQRTASMSVGLYVLDPAAPDDQSPHEEDEVYVVLGGRCQMTVASETRQLGPGSIVLVEKGVSHRFHDIEEELSVLVLFAPPQGTKSTH
jgi:mannose-6-phosphate isomerase-like protein (cupin superfamily)